MYAELLVKLNWNSKRDTKKALEAAKLLFQEAPSQMNADQVDFIENFDKLNDACSNVDKLCEYLDLTDNRKSIIPILDSLPDGITTMPFAQKIRQKYTPARRWGDNEICYFANFGAKHFEEWDMNSLKSGIGGSETAVLELAKQWTKLGYKVTIYGDPKIKGEQERITILPWYYFNPRDSFNVFIAWRSPAIAGRIKAKTMLVDMHDIYAEVDFLEKLPQIDKIMVKSRYHRVLGPMIPIEKFSIAGNGI